MYCRKCGFEFSAEGFKPGESIFCPKCGFGNEIPAADNHAGIERLADDPAEDGEDMLVDMSLQSSDGEDAVDAELAPEPPAAPAPGPATLDVDIDIDLDDDGPADGVQGFVPPWLPSPQPRSAASPPAHLSGGLDIELTEVTADITTSGEMKVETIGSTCPFCLDTYRQGDELTICPICHIPHHRECWAENDMKCTTFGCPGQGRGLEVRSGEDIEELLKRPVPVDVGFDEPRAPRRSAVDTDVRRSLDFAAPAPRFSPPPGGFVVTLSLIFVIAFLVLVMIYLNKNEGEAPAPSPQPVAEAPPAEEIDGMVLIPSSTAQIGWNEGFALPARSIGIEGFYIDSHEVTNAAWAEYVEETGASPPRHWPGGELPSGLEQHPVVNVSWDEAKAFAEWRGCRLPTEIEWERAARGSGGQSFPWGNVWDPVWANVFRSEGDNRAFEVMSISGDERDGVFDLAGNVREWTATPYRLNNVPLEGSQRIVRGSGFRTGAEQARGYYRQAELEDAKEDDLGFRCARDAS